MTESSPDAAPSETSFRRRLLVWAGSILGGLAVLVLVAALLLPRLFTSEQLKGYVIPPLEKATGRQVEIDAIGLRVLPAPAIRVSGFRLANAEGFGPAPAVKARALSVNVALWPLLLARIRPTAVGLEQPVIRYEVAEDGTTNFDDMVGEADTVQTEEPLLGGIPLSNVRVSGAHLHYADRGAGQVFRVDFDAQLGVIPEGPALTSDGTVDLRTVRALLPSVSPDTLTVRDARANYDVRVAPSAGDVNLRTLRLETAPITVMLDGTISGLNKQPTVDLKVETGATNLAHIAGFVPAAEVEGLNPRGTLTLKGTISGSWSGDENGTDALTVAATGRLAEVGVDYREEALLRDVSGDLSFSLDDVALRSIDGQLLGASLTGSAAIRQLREDPQIDLDLQTGVMNLSNLVAFVPPEQVGGYNPQGNLRLDATVKGPLPTDAASLKDLAVNGTGQLAGFGVDYDRRALLRSLKADLSFSGTTASARGIDGQLLGGPLSGALTVRDLRGTPQVEGTLAGSADVAQLLALLDSESSPSVQATADYDVSFVGPLDTPDAIRPSGRVRLTKVKVPYESFRHPIEIPDVTVQLMGTGLSADRFTIRSGQQTAALQATAQNLFPISKGLAESNPTLSASFTLTAGRLDLEALYPEDEASEVNYSDLFAAQLAGSRIDGQSPEALAEDLYGEIELPDYALNGRVEIKTLLNEPQRFDNLSVDVQMKDRRLRLQNLTASTYGGTLIGALTLDQSGSTSSASIPPTGSVRFASIGSAGSGGRRSVRTPAARRSNLTYNVQLRNAEAGAVLRDWTTIGRLLTGTLTLTADGESPLTAGLLPQTNALSAVGESVVVNGGLALDFGPASILVEALGLPGAPLRNFQRLGGPFVIRDGQLQVETWPFETDQFDGTVEGALGLGGSLDLKVTLNLPLELIQKSKIGSRLGGKEGQLSAVLKKLLGSPARDETIPVTVRIRGTMQDPAMQVLNQDAIESRIESLAKEAGLRRLRDLFGGSGSG